MPLRITGMNSGLDTDSIIRELVKASSEKKTKLEKTQTKLSWKMDAWKSLNTKVVSFYKKLDDLRMEGTYTKRTSSVSDPNAATVVPGDKAVNGSHELQVDSLAKGGYLTGGILQTKSGGKATSSTKLSELGASGVGMDADGAEFSVTSNGKSKTLKFSSDSTIQNVIDSLNSTGVNASFDEVNQRIHVNASATGEKNDFSITANNTKGLEALANMGLLNAADLTGGVNATWAGYVGATDSDTLANLTAAGEVEKREKERASEVLSDSKSRIQLIKDLEEWQEKQQKAYEKTGGLKEKLDKALDDADTQALLASKGVDLPSKEANILDLDVTKLKGAADALDKEAEEMAKKDTSIMTEDEKKAHFDRLSHLTASRDAITEAADTAEYAQSATKDIQDNMDALKENATLINELELGADGKYSIKKVTGADGSEKEATVATTTLKLDNQVADELVERAKTAKAAGSYSLAGTASATSARIIGQDAHIQLNGADYTSSTNNFNINGMQITAKAETTGSVTISTADDVDGIYDMIKGFLKDYNELIKEMDSLYNAASSKGYEPLTSEEKESLSEDEIEKWEDKIKDSLLRRDSNLGDLTNVMKNAMLQSYEVNGKEYTLASFGIETLGYFDSAANERGTYHINGDKDDLSTSGEKDKLRSMIGSDPKTVASFFSQLTNSVYEEVNSKMKSLDGVRSYQHIYDDKRMQSEYDDYTKKIKAQEAKLKALEDKYYSQFGAMETALAKLQGNQNAIASLLGTG